MQCAVALALFLPQCNMSRKHRQPHRQVISLSGPSYQIVVQPKLSPHPERSVLVFQSPDDQDYRKTCKQAHTSRSAWQQVLQLAVAPATETGCAALLPTTRSPFDDEQPLTCFSGVSEKKKTQTQALGSKLATDQPTHAHNGHKHGDTRTDLRAACRTVKPEPGRATRSARAADASSTELAAPEAR